MTDPVHSANPELIRQSAENGALDAHGVPLKGMRPLLVQGWRSSGQEALLDEYTSKIAYGHTACVQEHLVKHAIEVHFAHLLAFRAISVAL